MRTNLREISRTAMTGTTTPDGFWANKDIDSGSLQRIADAAEKIAAGFDAVLKKLKATEESLSYAQSRGDVYRNRADRAERRIRSLRGYITRLTRLKKAMAK